jgi:hypothetical protein
MLRDERPRLLAFEEEDESALLILPLVLRAV